MSDILKTRHEYPITLEIPGDPAHRDALTVPATPRGRAWKAEQEAERRGYLRGIEDAARMVDAAKDAPCAKCGAPRSNHPYRHPFVGAVACDAAAIRQLAKEKPHADRN